MGQLHELTPEQMEHALDALADIAKKKTRETERDELTDLLNRKQMSKVIEQAIHAKKRFGIMFLDLDRFKKVNDTFGHSKGDELLKLLATHLGENLRRSFTRENDRLAVEAHAGRLAGDEFIIYIDLSELGQNRADTPEEALARAELYLYEVVEQFVEDAIQTLQLPRDVGLGGSVGSELFDPANPKTAEEILNSADAKMYAAKERRRAGR